MKTADVLQILGRNSPLLTEDIARLRSEIAARVEGSSFLVVGAARTIGAAVTKEIIKYNPKKVHAVDISENNLAELVREVRSSQKVTSDFRTFVICITSKTFDEFFEVEGPYDYVLNLSALKHVRSEKDVYTLSRMVEVNLYGSLKLAHLASDAGAKKYFCVSTDKAANPANIMGATKRAMELMIGTSPLEIDVSFARFANVAFSDGSLPHGFVNRVLRGQPITAPSDIRRYFVTQQESGEICLLSCLFGEDHDIFFPRLKEGVHEMTFAQIAEKFLALHGKVPVLFLNEEDARFAAETTDISTTWPCYFFESDTTGEKAFEEFFMVNEKVDLSRFAGLGVAKLNSEEYHSRRNEFANHLEGWILATKKKKQDLVSILQAFMPEFSHSELERNLDQKM